MKKLVILMVTVITIASCTKTKTNIVTVIQHDTTTVTIRPILLGTWKSTTGVSPVIFDSTTYTVQSFPSITYIASPDTIYDISETNIVYPKWAYVLSAHNDSLTLTTLRLSTPVVDVYTRQ